MAVNENNLVGVGEDTATGERHEIRHLPEEPVWHEGIYQIERNDEIIGGAGGVANVQARQLAERTSYLNELVKRLQEAIPGTDEYNEIIDQIRHLDLTKTNASVAHLERLMANAYLAFEMANIDPDGYDNMIIETFNDGAKEIDQAVVDVTSVVSGSDNIDVSSSDGLIIGAHYQLTDGERIEEVQIRSLNVSGSIKRVILYEPVRNQYADGRAKLYRSSVAIWGGRAYGGGNVRTDEWAADHSFSGSDTAQDITSALAFDNAEAFDVEGAVLDGGKFVLGNEIVGIALVATGGGSGTWKRVNEEGDDLT